MFLYQCDVKGIILNIQLSPLKLQQNNLRTFMSSRQTPDSSHSESISYPENSRAYATPHISKAYIQKLKRQQQALQEIFLNPNISIGDAPIMIERYKDLEKIEDKEEYIKAVFEEAKNNFGFRKSKMQLQISPPEHMQGYIGGADTAFYNVQIRSDIPREKVLETIHQ